MLLNTQYLTGLASQLVECLKSKSLKVSCAESCTGGLFSAFLTEVPGCSAVYRGSVVSYSNNSKIKILKVNHKTIKAYGAVSEEVAREMCVEAANLFETEISVGITGVAGPGGGTKEKPIGTVWLGFYFKGEVSTEKIEFSGDRSQVRSKTVNYIIEILLKKLKEII